MSTVNVEVRHDPSRINREKLLPLAVVLPKIVAEAMSCSEISDGPVFLNEVRVALVQAFPAETLNAEPVEINVFAHARSERIKNVRERRRAIAEKAKEFLPKGTRCILNVFLVPISSERFES